MEFAFIFLAIIVIAYLILNKTQKKIRLTSQKKDQIVHSYIKELGSALSKAKDDEEKKQIKNSYLKRYNSELSRNIFFTQDEATKALEKLASL